MSDTDELGLGNTGAGGGLGESESNKQEPVKLVPIEVRTPDVDMNGPSNIADYRKAGFEPFKTYMDVRTICEYIRDANGNVVGVNKVWKNINSGEILSHVPFDTNKELDDREDGVATAFKLKFNSTHIDVDPENKYELMAPAQELTAKIAELTGGTPFPSGMPHRSGQLCELTQETFDAIAAKGYKLNETGNAAFYYKGVKVEFRFCISKDKSLKVYVPDNGNYKLNHRKEYADVKPLNKETVNWLFDNCTVSGNGISKLSGSASTTTTTTTTGGGAGKNLKGKNKDIEYIKLNSTSIKPQTKKTPYRKPPPLMRRVIASEFYHAQLLYKSFIDPTTAYLYPDHKEEFFSDKCTTRIKHATEGLKRLRNSGIDIRHDMDSDVDTILKSVPNIRWQSQNDPSQDKLMVQRVMELILLYYIKSPCYYDKVKHKHNVRAYEKNWYDNPWISDAMKQGFNKTLTDKMFTMELTKGPNKGELKHRYDPNAASGALDGIKYKNKEILLLEYQQHTSDGVKTMYAVAETKTKTVMVKPDNTQRVSLFFNTKINDIQETQNYALPNDYSYGVINVHMIYEPRKGFGFTGEYENGLPVFNCRDFSGQLKILTGNEEDTSKFRYPETTIDIIDSFYRSDDLDEWQESVYYYEQKEPIEEINTTKLTRTVELVDGIYNVKEIWRRKRNLHRDYFEKIMAFKAFVPMRDQIVYEIGFRRIGKDFKYTTVLGSLFGRENVAFDTTVKDLTDSNYNGDIADKLFDIISDPGELTKKQTTEFGDILKSTTGKDMLQLRQKYMKVGIYVKNNLTFIITSNFALPIPNNDRIVQLYISGWQEDGGGELTSNPKVKDLSIDTESGQKVGVAALQYLLEQDSANYAHYLFRTHAPNGANSAANLEEHFRINDSPKALERAEQDNSIQDTLARALGSIFKHKKDVESENYNQSVDRLVKLIIKRKVFSVSDLVHLGRLFTNNVDNVPMGGLLYGVIPLKCIMFLVNNTGVGETQNNNTFSLSEHYIRKLLHNNEVRFELESDIEKVYDGSPYIIVPKFGKKFVDKLIELKILKPDCWETIKECGGIKEKLTANSDKIINSSGQINNAIDDIAKLLDMDI